jgi:hypothetical protein
MAPDWPHNFSYASGSAMLLSNEHSIFLVFIREDFLYVANGNLAHARHTIVWQNLGKHLITANRQSVE